MIHRAAAFVVVLALMLAGCAKKEEAAKQYAMRGVVVSLDQKTQTATIQHEKIGDWMEAMTMEFPVREKADWQKLTPGARITATVFVGDAAYYIGNVQVASGK